MVEARQQSVMQLTPILFAAVMNKVPMVPRGHCWVKSVELMHILLWNVYKLPERPKSC